MIEGEAQRNDKGEQKGEPDPAAKLGGLTTEQLKDPEGDEEKGQHDDGKTDGAMDQGPGEPGPGDAELILDRIDGDPLRVFALIRDQTDGEEEAEKDKEKAQQLLTFAGVEQGLGLGRVLFLRAFAHGT